VADTVEINLATARAVAARAATPLAGSLGPLD
jgi:hypothetical protein